MRYGSLGLVHDYYYMPEDFYENVQIGKGFFCKPNLLPRWKFLYVNVMSLSKPTWLGFKCDALHEYESTNMHINMFDSINV